MVSPSVGYVRLVDFNETTACRPGEGDDCERELEKALRSLQKSGAKAFILDIRDNPGGLLDQAFAVSNLFLKKGQLVVFTRGRTRRDESNYITEAESPWVNVPLVVLTSRHSASASEIVAGALQDHDRALIVGETTFGKGLVQSIYRISEGNGLALTTAQYFTPSGRSIQRDYSGSIDDYYYSARAEEPPPPHGEAKLTDAGRKVYSGGGIAPDIHVSYPRLPQPVLALNSRNAFFKYATRFAAKDENRSVEGAGVQPKEIRTARPKYVRLVDERFRVNDEVLEDFFGFLDSEQIPYSRQELLAAREQLALRIEVEIFNALWGSEAAQKIAVTRDPQIQAALAALPDAAQLLVDPAAYAKRVVASGPEAPGQKTPQP
jgi:carboxyl-terminal processing protease